MKRLQYLWEKINASFWFIPLLILVVAISAAICLLYYDSVKSFTPTGVWQYLYAESSDSARSILSTIAGAMIGVAGTTFSITIVALTLASSQFGSRLLRNFMYDKVNQVVLGTYISTFVYCLIVLNAVRSGANQTFVPHVSVLFAILTAVFNIILLIVFFHHIAISIQSDTVVANISKAMATSMKQLFPERIGEEREEKEHPSVDELKRKFLNTEIVACPASGYLQSVDLKYLMELAMECDMIIQLDFRPGNYMVEDIKMASILSNKPVDDDITEKIQGAFIIGQDRTALQDAEFSIHQMVEIASRALSPGVNDPYTAISCIDNLTSVLCYLVRAKFPSSFRYDEEDHLRLIAISLTFEGMLNAAFNQIRQYAEGNPSVVIRLLEVLAVIYDFAETDQPKQAVRKHADMVIALGERAFKENEDLKDLKERWKH